MIELVPADPNWPAIAEHESERLSTALGAALVAIYHIGSTAIPGIVAKPIIDLMPVVESLAAVDHRERQVRELSYDWRGEFGIPGRRFCTLNDPATGERRQRTHLRPRFEARDYEAAKQRAAAIQSSDVLEYNRLKEPFIQACERRALAWSLSVRVTAHRIHFDPTR